MDPSKDGTVPAEIPSHHYWDSLRLHTWCTSWWWLLIGLFSGLLCITWHSGCLMFKWQCPLLEPWSTKSTEAGGWGGWMGQVLTGRWWTAHWDTAGLRSHKTCSWARIPSGTFSFTPPFLFHWPFIFGLTFGLGFRKKWEMIFHRERSLWIFLNHNENDILNSEHQVGLNKKEFKHSGKSLVRSRIQAAESHF